jgi:serine/threonine-protein kinase RsbW
VTGQWTLPDDLTAARAAREHVAAALRGRPECDDVVLVASELAANAVRHGQPPYALQLEVGPLTILVTVSNHGDQFDPTIVETDPDSDSGRGLAIIQALAQEVGSWRAGDRLGVWARVGIPR